MSDGHESHDYQTYRVRRKEHTPEKSVPLRASEAWMAAKEFAEAFDLPNKSLVVVSYETHVQVAANAKAPKTIERIFEISVGKLYGASEQ